MTTERQPFAIHQASTVSQENNSPSPLRSTATLETSEPKLDPWEVVKPTDFAEEVTAFIGDLERWVEGHSETRLSSKEWSSLIRRHALPDGRLLRKWVILQTYLGLCEWGDLELKPELLNLLQVKRVRTLSGVAPVTVLTKPYPCPGQCIFCPTDVRMPKSYLIDEPGAMRAYRANFDPHVQVKRRIETLYKNGHAVGKIELLILGGTWSSYKKKYQEEFILRCFDAMNLTTSPHLEAAHHLNEQATHRNVGLVVETRPDHVDLKEIRWMRRLGVTKVQIGLQSMNDEVLRLNKRGHTLAETAEALRLLRRAGFKLVLHWMPNLLGATPESDLEDFKSIWTHLDIQPDELKIYPCSLLKNAELYEYWKRGEWVAYDDDVLTHLIARCKDLIPTYCRINRVFRDIHPHHIVTGMNRLNFRQMVHAHMEREGLNCKCIRCREVKGSYHVEDDLTLESVNYITGVSQEEFLIFETSEKKIAAFLRLSLPHRESLTPYLDELEGAALVREVHVYGPARALKSSPGEGGETMAQHQGLGARLLREAEERASSAGYSRLAIIAAVGTRGYYARHGYRRAEGETYMIKPLSQTR